MHARSRIALSAAVAALALCVTARTAQSQQVIPSLAAESPTTTSRALAPRTPPADVAAPTPSAGPTMDAARAGVTQQTSSELKTAAQARRRGMGQPVALMVVGGAALLTGLIIGGDAGTVIAVGGALVGLYGLYEYLQ
jgi:hypothetical protein